MSFSGPRSSGFEMLKRLGMFWALVCRWQRIARIADRRTADRSPRRHDFAISDPLEPCFRWRTRDLREEWRRAHPSGASGTN
eukprot:8406613-Alexandrium_andersonii.AAC.1